MILHGRRAAIVAAVVLCATAGAIAAACGTSAKVTVKGSGGGGASGATLKDPTAVFDKLRGAAASINTVAYTADIEITATAASGAPAASPSSSSGLQLGQLLSQGVTVHADGAVSKQPSAAHMTIDAKLGAQAFKAEVTADDSGAYVNFMGNWYKVPPDQTDKFKQLATQSPADVFKGVGVDMGQLSSQRQLVGVETIDGAQCYHIKATPDAAQVAEDVGKFLNSPQFSGTASPGASSLGVSTDTAALQQALKSVTVEYWVDAQTGYVRKGVVAVQLAAPPGDTSGIATMDVKVSFTARDFNKPVTVQAPPTSLPFDQLGQALLGGSSGSGL